MSAYTIRQLILREIRAFVAAMSVSVPNPGGSGEPIESIFSVAGVSEADAAALYQAARNGTYRQVLQGWLRGDPTVAPAVLGKIAAVIEVGPDDETDLGSSGVDVFEMAVAITFHLPEDADGRSPADPELLADAIGATVYYAAGTLAGDPNAMPPRTVAGNWRYITGNDYESDDGKPLALWTRVITKGGVWIGDEDGLVTRRTVVGLIVRYRVKKGDAYTRG